MGPSLAYGSIVDGDDHPVYGLDAVYVHQLVWAGGGARLIHDDGPTVLPYVEAGFWLFLNVGLGVTYIANSPREEELALHLFLGQPIPLFEISPGGEELGGVYVEPYYRPLWWSGPTLHEVGILAKFTTWH